MRIHRIIFVLLFSLLTACTSQSNLNEQEESKSTVEPSVKSIQGELATVPINDQDLEGIWIRVITAMPDPDKSGHFWLKLNPDGTFKVTENKMGFDGDVAHQGTFTFKDNIFTFNAEEGSLRCKGQSASYEATKFEDGTMAFVTLEAPCEKWLSMGQGKLGEGTLWVRPNE